MALDSSPGVGSELSVVVVTYNSGYAVHDALTSIREHLPAAEIVVVDNGSNDDSLAVVRNHGVETVISGHGNVGYGAAVNLGIEATTRNAVLVINPDIVIRSVASEPQRELTGLETTGLVACTAPREAIRAEAPIMAAWGWRRELAWALFMWFLKPRGLGLRRPALKTGRTGWVSGAAFMVSKHEWAGVGGFDDEIFLYFEDFDLSRRYQAAGLPLRATSAVCVEHARQESERTTELELLQSWALRSLIQTTATWEGEPEAVRAARATLLSLAALAKLATLATRVPVVRSRAARKARSARLVRAHLNEHPPGGVNPRCYAEANRALLAARRQPH